VYSVTVPDIGKQYPRGGTSPDSKLPSFMEGIFDRTSMNVLSKKMLE